MSSTVVAQRPAGLSGGELRTLALAALGGALEFYDFVIFAYFAKIIAQHFFPAAQPDWLRQTETFGLFGAGYLARPLGGVIMAHFGDTLGRKKMFAFSVLLMAVPTLLMGLLPGFGMLGVGAPLALLVLRVLQGAAIGGEAPGGWVFVAEHAGAGRVGLACGLLTGGLTAGMLIGSLVALALNTALPPATVADWGWRIPFLLGGVFGLIAMVLRRWLEETPVFAEMHARAELARRLPLATILAEHRLAVMLSIMATWTLTAAIVVLLLMMPALLQTLHGFSPSATLYASLVATLSITVAAVLVGAGTDRWGLRAMIPPVVGLLVLGAWGLYDLAPAHPGWFLPLAALAGFGGSYVSLVPIAMVGAFPAAVRFSGLSFSYNLSYAIFGGLTPACVSALVTHSPYAPALYVSATALAGAFALWAMPGQTSPTPGSRAGNAAAPDEGKGHLSGA
ncbi:major facilitator superfamily transporter [Gluconacetobacter johannae DSM 13595]|uniref:MFS transporter n=1 Tax=Gluconacetobacter johannae TaxID=112140 RepID=A0A7W4J5B7_9PROT|nr:MFS transporter [Gluconacetobacter johannae]MBB2175023.1 MFS transporter [Gluconacetobacter johannae]GBQ87283.1 major facilitator superfamily transporter [Gluconacetobacter johannae DSM 13595]